MPTKLTAMASSNLHRMSSCSKSSHHMDTSTSNQCHPQPHQACSSQQPRYTSVYVEERHSFVSLLFTPLASRSPYARPASTHEATAVANEPCLETPSSSAEHIESRPHDYRSELGVNDSASYYPYSLPRNQVLGMHLTIPHKAPAPMREITQLTGRRENTALEVFMSLRTLHLACGAQLLHFETKAWRQHRISVPARRYPCTWMPRPAARQLVGAKHGKPVYDHFSWPAYLPV